MGMFEDLLKEILGLEFSGTVQKFFQKFIIYFITCYHKFHLLQNGLYLSIYPAVPAIQRSSCRSRTSHSSEKFQAPRQEFMALGDGSETLGFLPRMNTLWWTNILLWKDPPFLMGKSTINGHFPWQNVSSPEGTLYIFIPFLDHKKSNAWGINTIFGFVLGCPSSFFTNKNGWVFRNPDGMETGDLSGQNCRIHWGVEQKRDYKTEHMGM